MKASIMIKKILATGILWIPLFLLSCELFEPPEGKAELLDIHKRNEQGWIEGYFSGPTNSSSQTYKEKEQEVLYSYLCATLKLTNLCNKNIYNSTISIQAKAGDRTYYKTVSLDITIAPGKSIFIPVEIEKYTKQLKAADTEDEAWIFDSMEIIGETFR
ncbi:MAG: hypothetical protein IKX23_06615 [Treponema sp.]|nr:hypothetical protein [Treponema sp.]